MSSVNTVPIESRESVGSWKEVDWPAIFVLAVFLATALRLLQAVLRYSVNLIFWDQWDFYTPLFHNASLWEIFRWEHAPHREGIGLVLDSFVLRWTHWNTEAEALFMLGVLLLAGVAAVVLKQKLFGSLNYTDWVIPCLFLAYVQLEVLVGEENPSYSVFPELLIALYCLSWTIPARVVRYATVLALNFLLIYTGFGIFMGVVTFGVLLLDLRRALRTDAESPAFSAVALLIAMGSMGSFFYHYRWNPALSCPIPDPHPIRYPWFVSLLFSYFLGVRTVVWASVLGGVIVLAVVSILVWHGIRLWRDGVWVPIDVSIVVLLSFTLLFAFNASAGRVCLGLPEAAQFSRYMGLLVPGLLGIYFHLLTWRKGGWRAVATLIFAVALIPATFRTPGGYSPQIVHDGKQAWSQCIRSYGDIGYCDYTTHFPAYPFPRKTQMVEKLQFLQRNRLNLYSERH